ncbi:YheT family hydrolase [Roseateles sp.]|uniref:YheT family hydrolase n=1 Tax=Roseateles sp. TaxID=1971397 RepID=UPI003951AE05
MKYAAPRWLPGGHAQTIWPALFSRTHSGGPLAWRRERWDTPDGDFIDVDFLPAARSEAPLLVLFHGLEGDRHSHSSRSFAGAARALGWQLALPHFRGCSGELNRAPRAYHSGDYAEIDWILRRLRQRHGRPPHVVGVSLGGNALMRWAGEMGESAQDLAQAVASVCSPLDLAACGIAIDQGFNRVVYARRFLRTMVPKALRKLQQHPGLFDGERLRRATTIREFDDAFTAPLHGFAGVDDYYARASARPHLHRIRVPALALNACNDPFVPAHSLPGPEEAGTHVTLWQPLQGGHVGFASGLPPGYIRSLPEQVLEWLQRATAGS